MKKISDKMVDALNRQVTAEFESAYIYLSMADYLHAQNFDGMAHWFRIQADEEKKHALKINDFMVERNIAPQLGEIQAPQKDWADLPALFEDAYRQECQISDRIYDLVAQGMDDKDFATLSFLQWFVDEQVEEEAQSLELSEKVRLAGDVTAGLMVLDQQMGSRRN